MSGSGATSSGGGSPSGGSGAAQSGTAGAAGESVYYQPTPTPVNFTGTGTFQTACDLHIATIGRIGPWGTSTIFNQWLTTRGATAATSLGDQVLTPALLAQYKIIVALNLAQFTIVWRGQTLDPYKSHAYSASEAQALAAWVTAGGGLMTTIGYTPQPAAEPANINFLLTFASMSYATSTNVSGDVSKWVAHPVTNGMGVARTDKGAQPLGAGQVVGWDISGDQTLRVNQVGSGKIVMWGDEWITYDPYWTNVTQLDIELLWVNIFNWLSPPAQCHLPLPPK